MSLITFSLVWRTLQVRNSWIWEKVHRRVWQSWMRLESQGDGADGEEVWVPESRDSILKRKSLLGQDCFCIILLLPRRREIIILDVCCIAWWLCLPYFWSQTSLNALCGWNIQKAPDHKAGTARAEQECFLMLTMTYILVQKEIIYLVTAKKTVCVWVWRTK